MDPQSAECLRAARERALERQRLEPAYGHAWADNVIGNIGGFSGISVRFLLPMAVLVIGLLAINSWQQKQRAVDVEEVDALLLTGDLPIDAYLDKDFQAWLKRRG
ncbi:MAG: DUF3619 family protein [Betaproteobacteria bacterium]|nr:DUF3619 family protein [Betaproteobacteria bacterium]